MILQFNLLSFVGPDVLHLRPDEAVEVRGRVVRIADDQGLVLPPELVGGHAPAKPVRGNEFAELGKEKSKEFVMNSFVLKLKSSLNVFGWFCRFTVHFTLVIPTMFGQIMARGGGQVVNLLAFYTDDLSLNATEGTIKTAMVGLAPSPYVHPHFKSNPSVSLVNF